MEIKRHIVCYLVWEFLPTSGYFSCYLFYLENLYGVSLLLKLLIVSLAAGRSVFYALGVTCNTCTNKNTLFSWKL